ncbi:hypothetical protein AX16_006398 [Volvariella volvacea WC 439]|nr:hypothetical protein AX16_006398 [Volvariella volvacea WC 439]
MTAALSADTCHPNKERTIFDILYSCLGVIFLCTYISIHHNIPDQNDSWTRKTWLKLRTMLYAMLAPEVVIVWALRQRIMAGEIANSEWGKGQGWTKTHAFFVQMGGLMKVDEGKYEVVLWRSLDHRKGLYVGEDAIEQIPKIREKEIQDRGKGDLLAKAIVVLQTSWFVVQCAARHIEGLVLTELELATLAFATLNVMTYILWWEKPLNVEYLVYFDKEGRRVDGPEESKGRVGFQMLWKVATGRWQSDSRDKVGLWGGAQESPKQGHDAWETVWKQLQKIKQPFEVTFGPLMEMTHAQWHSGNRSTSVHPFYAASLQDYQLRRAYICGSAIGVVFGAIHLVGWNFPFSTPTERWLWRSCALILTATPAVIVVSWPLQIEWWETADSDPLIHRVLWFLVVHVGSPLYIAARVTILFLAFFALCDLPDPAYHNIEWSNFIPHI